MVPWCHQELRLLLALCHPLICHTEILTLWLPHRHELQESCLHSSRKKGKTKTQNVLCFWGMCLLSLILCTVKFPQMYHSAIHSNLSLAKAMSDGCLLVQGRRGKLLPRQNQSSYSKKEGNALGPNCTHCFLSCSFLFILHSAVRVCFLKENLNMSVLL